MDISQLDLTPEEKKQYQMAQDSGFSDDEIIQHLSGQSKQPEIPNYHPGKLKVGETVAPLSQGSVIPAWKQTAIQGVNKLPELGQAVGTAAGMVPMLAPGAQPSAALTIPAGAAAGRVVGRGAQSLLTKMLLPNADESQTPSQLPEEAIQGATGGMLDALLMKAGSQALTGRPFEGLEKTFNPETTVSAKGRNFLTKRIVKPSMKNPTEAKSAIETIGKGKMDIVGGTAPERVEQGISNISGDIDSAIEDAAKSGKMLKIDDILKPVDRLASSYSDVSDMPEYLQKTLKYAEDFRAMNPRKTITPQKAQDLKKFVYKTLKGTAWEGNTYRPVTEAKKSLGSGLKTGLEEVAPEIGPKNEELSKLLQARPYVQAGAEKMQEQPLRTRLFSGLQQKGANALEYINAGQRSRPNFERNIPHEVSPYHNLEEMFGVPKYSISPIEANPKDMGRSPAWKAEMARPPMPQSTKIGRFTKEEVIQALANGDSSVLPDVAAGVKQYGKYAMMDEIVNGTMSVAYKNKTYDKLLSINKQLQSVLRGGAE